MRTWIAGMALAAAPACVLADAVTIYKMVDDAGRVTYTNQKPRHADYDVVNIEYDPPGKAQALPVAAPPKALPVEAPPPVPQAATLSVLAFPSLRLASVNLEQPMRSRRKAAAGAFALRLETQLRSLAP